MLQVYLNLLDTQEDKEKFEQLYALYKDKMYKVAYQILHNRHDAEDAVHDSVIAIIDNLEKIKKINCHETWSYIVTIVKSRTFNIYQRKGKRSEREAREQDYRNYPCEQQESPEDAYLYKDVTTILQESDSLFTLLYGYDVCGDCKDRGVVRRKCAPDRCPFQTKTGKTIARKGNHRWK